MKKAALLIISVFVLSIALSAQGKGRHGDKNSMYCPGFEQREGRKGPDSMHPFFLESKKMIKELNLTEDQLSKIKAVNNEFKKKADPIHENQKALHEKMKKLDDDENSSISDYENIIKEMSANRTEIQILHAKHRIEIRNILTKEQKDKLKTKRDKMREKEKPRKHNKDHSED